MSDILCLLCKDDLETFNIYNLDTDCTMHTNTNLRSFLSKVFENKLHFTERPFICLKCKELLDELEYTETVYKKLVLKIWGYCCYKDAETVTINILSKDSLKRKEYNCHICFKKFASSKGSARHIQKVHNTSASNNDTNNKTEDKSGDISIEDISQSQFWNTYGSDSEDEATPLLESESKPCLPKANDVSETMKTNKTPKKKRHKTPEQSKQYPCTMCPKTWRTLGQMKSHLSAHSHVRPFICEVCGQAYKHKHALDIHVGMHNGINPFMCSYCRKSFTQKGALLRHLPIHTGEAPYQCDLCGKRFIHHTSFKLHKLSHSGEKQYKCIECGLALVSASHLKRHMRVHTGERNYICNLCGKRFAEKYNLLTHQKLHENTKNVTSYKRNYRCQPCGATFSRKLQLDEHTAKEHKNISSSGKSPKEKHICPTDFIKFNSENSQYVTAV